MGKVVRRGSAELGRRVNEELSEVLLQNGNGCMIWDARGRLTGKS